MMQNGFSFKVDINYDEIFTHLMFQENYPFVYIGNSSYSDEQIFVKFLCG